MIQDLNLTGKYARQNLEDTDVAGELLIVFPQPNTHT